ncbi:MAG: potassium channel protein [Deltaproteobacteria bacterium]|nr:potassium channel protein [Deltaproteobacteria bacterium]
MDTLKRILLWAVSLLVFMVLGAVGFVWLEGFSFFDALYLTVLSLTTVGFGDIVPVTRLGRAYTMVLVLSGIGLMFYIVTALARVVVEGEIKSALGKRKLLKHIKKLHGHYIICGFGRIGEIIARQLKERKIPLVIIENNPELLSLLEESSYYFINGDATKEEVLLEAGIDKAKGLVAVVSSDASNVFITLTARSLNPNLFIVARGVEPGSEQKLLRAGADRVESPYELGGRKMAQTILRPNVTTFIELAMKEDVDLWMEEIVVNPASSLVGLALKDSGIRQQLNTIVVSIKRASGEMLFNPSPGTQIFAGDTLIALGMRQSLEALEKIAGV